VTGQKTQEFSGQEWVELLSKDRDLHDEKVIITGKFSPTLKLNKKDWEKYFADFGGIVFEQGLEIAIVPLNTGGPKAKIPEWVWSHLKASPGERYCITERKGRYYLKKLELIERSTSIPHLTIMDSFDRAVVRRMYSGFLDLQQVMFKDLERLLRLMGKFKHDPISPFKKMAGKIGYLGRKEFIGRTNEADGQFMRDYVKAFENTQLENGSWEDSTMITAFNIIKLHECGVTLENPVMDLAAKWLLSTREPLGFPGLFMLSEKLVSRFNAWKASQMRGRSGRPHRRTTEREAHKYLEHRAVLSSISAWPCELRLTWTSGIVIEALLRCGLHQEPRVVKAINTLFKMSERGRWCGCGYFDTRDMNFVTESSEPVDFNRRPALKFSLDDNFIARLVCDDYRLLALKAGKNRALLTNRFRSTGECSMVVLKALSFHPEFPGSHFEANSALSCAGYLGMDGVEEDAYTSSVFGLLTNMTHVFAAFLVLRSVPVLIRRQQKDGLWQEKPIGSCPAPTKEESSYMILRAFKKFGFLDALIP
jgi:hypothetical protein